MRNAMIAAVAGSLLAGSATAHPQDIPRRVLVILAHPDDKLPIAPALAIEAGTGSRVQTAYATWGEAGPGVSGMEKGEELGRTRLKEAMCASEALGLGYPKFMDYGDGKLTDRPLDENSPALRFKQELESYIT